ncbi:MAG TPA: arylesterase [Caulobacteraceae bacterium]|jgi:acyl-CoA thioesterase-1|nr:arylesterase [Caulobacteraceae bacterium]
MAKTSSPRISRRGLIAGALALGATPVLAAGRAPVVTILGDSITAGLGLAQADALPARLQAALARLGIHAIVRGAGVSGDTTAGGLQRLDFSVQNDTAVCVVALGGNDLLQGLDPRAMQANLTRIVERLKQRRIGVVLCGLTAPDAIGKHYAHDYDAVFPAVAKAERVAFYPDLRKGVANVRGFTQSDGLHPNAAGVLIIARGLAPVVGRALKAHG